MNAIQSSSNTATGASFSSSSSSSSNPLGRIVKIETPAKKRKSTSPDQSLSPGIEITNELIEAAKRFKDYHSIIPVTDEKSKQIGEIIKLLAPFANGSSSSNAKQSTAPIPAIPVAPEYIAQAVPAKEIHPFTFELLKTMQLRATAPLLPLTVSRAVTRSTEPMRATSQMINHSYFGVPNPYSSTGFNTMLQPHYAETNGFMNMTPPSLTSLTSPNSHVSFALPNASFSSSLNPTKESASGTPSNTL